MSSNVPEHHTCRVDGHVWRDATGRLVKLCPACGADLHPEMADPPFDYRRGKFNYKQEQ